MVTRVDIYEDRLEYRARRYETTTALAIGMKAARDAPRIIELHDCARLSDLEAVLDLVRTLGQENLSIVLPEDC
jgi:hypothetical protein